MHITIQYILFNQSSLKTNNSESSVNMDNENLFSMFTFIFHADAFSLSFGNVSVFLKKAKITTSLKNVCCLKYLND